MRRLTLRQISSRSGGPPEEPRLPHWGSFSDMEVSRNRGSVGGVAGSRVENGRDAEYRIGRHRPETARRARRANPRSRRPSMRSNERCGLYQTRRGRFPDRWPAASILFMTRICGTCSAPISVTTASTAAACSSRHGCAASMTCSIRSASPASFNVARNAATRSCGRSRMKPTVSDSTIGAAPGAYIRRSVVSSVANSWSAAKALAPVIRLNSVDLPAFV